MHVGGPEDAGLPNYPQSLPCCPGPGAAEKTALTRPVPRWGDKRGVCAGTRGSWLGDGAGTVGSVQRGRRPRGLARAWLNHSVVSAPVVCAFACYKCLPRGKGLTGFSLVWCCRSSMPIVTTAWILVSASPTDCGSGMTPFGIVDSRGLASHT